jgi:type III secretory pathway component EscV
MAGVAGLVFVVLSAAIVVTAPPIPALTASGAEIMTYYTNNQTGFLVGTYLGAVALLPGFLLIAYLIVQIRRGEPDGGSLWVLVIVANAGAWPRR